MMTTRQIARRLIAAAPGFAQSRRDAIRIAAEFNCVGIEDARAMLLTAAPGEHLSWTGEYDAAGHETYERDYYAAFRAAVGAADGIEEIIDLLAGQITADSEAAGCWAGHDWAAAMRRAGRAAYVAATLR